MIESKTSENARNRLPRGNLRRVRRGREKKRESNDLDKRVFMLLSKRKKILFVFSWRSGISSFHS